MEVMRGFKVRLLPIREMSVVVGCRTLGRLSSEDGLNFLNHLT
jgi:hypothetical protein